MVLLVILSAAALVLTTSKSVGATKIDHEPITLEQANSLIDRAQVQRVAIRPERNDDEFWLNLYEGSETVGSQVEPSRRWKVTGLEVFVFTEGTPGGVPILSSQDEDEVGLNADEFSALIQHVKEFNGAASSPIEVLDQRGGSDSLSVPR